MRPPPSKTVGAPSATGDKPARAASFSASSEESGHPASHAFDGATETRWCASSAALNEWLRIDFDTPRAIGGMEILWEHTDDEYGYAVEGSADGRVWKDLAKATNSPAARRTKLSGTYTALRIKVTALPTGKRWASISEVRLFDDLEQEELSASHTQ